MTTTQAAGGSSPVPSSANGRTLGRIDDLGPPEPGFAGPGHTAVEVFSSTRLAQTDPFVLLMDDRIAFTPGARVGGPHPHAGLQTVTFVLEGTLEDRDEGLLQAGDVAWMTAGSGVIHNEEVQVPSGIARVLQLWITLPEKQRTAAPRVDVIRGAQAPVYRAPGVEARLYSGSSNGLFSPTRNQVPVTLVDLRLEPGALFTQELPAGYGGFLVPLAGALRIGPGEQPLTVGQVGWLDRPHDDATLPLQISATVPGTRALLYAGQRQNEPTVHRGPFVAGSADALNRMYAEYGAGRFPRLSQTHAG
jgi:redox-sensitive bicupin YhaK (pirin superfamily)